MPIIDMENYRQLLETIIQGVDSVPNRNEAMNRLSELVCDQSVLGQVKQVYQRGKSAGKWNLQFDQFYEQLKGYKGQSYHQACGTDQHSPINNLVEVGFISLIEKASSFQSTGRTLLLRWLNFAQKNQLNGHHTIARPLMQFHEYFILKRKDNLKSLFKYYRREKMTKRGVAKINAAIDSRLSSIYKLIQKTAHLRHRRQKLIKTVQLNSYYVLEKYALLFKYKQAFQKIRNYSQFNLDIWNQKQQINKAKKLILPVYLQLKQNTFTNIKQVFDLIKDNKKMIYLCKQKLARAFNHAQKFQKEQLRNFLKQMKKQAFKQYLAMCRSSQTIKSNILQKLKKLSKINLRYWLLKWSINTRPQLIESSLNKIIIYSPLSPFNFMFRLIASYRGYPIFSNKKTTTILNQTLLSNFILSSINQEDISLVNFAKQKGKNILNKINYKAKLNFKMFIQQLRYSQKVKTTVSRFLKIERNYICLLFHKLKSYNLYKIILAQAELLTKRKLLKQQTTCKQNQSKSVCYFNVSLVIQKQIKRKLKFFFHILYSNKLFTLINLLSRIKQSATLNNKKYCFASLLQTISKKQRSSLVQSKLIKAFYSNQFQSKQKIKTAFYILKKRFIIMQKIAGFEITHIMSLAFKRLKKYAYDTIMFNSQIDKLVDARSKIDRIIQIIVRLHCSFFYNQRKQAKLVVYLFSKIKQKVRQAYLKIKQNSNYQRNIIIEPFNLLHLKIGLINKSMAFYCIRSISRREKAFNILKKILVGRFRLSLQMLRLYNPQKTAACFSLGILKQYIEYKIQTFKKQGFSRLKLRQHQPQYRYINNCQNCLLPGIMVNM